MPRVDLAVDALERDGLVERTGSGRIRLARLTLFSEPMHASVDRRAAGLLASDGNESDSYSENWSGFVADSAARRASIAIAVRS